MGSTCWAVEATKWDNAHMKMISVKWKDKKITEVTSFTNPPSAKQKLQQTTL